MSNSEHGTGIITNLKLEQLVSHIELCFDGSDYNPHLDEEFKLEDEFPEHVVDLLYYSLIRSAFLDFCDILMGSNYSDDEVNDRIWSYINRHFY